MTLASKAVGRTAGRVTAHWRAEPDYLVIGTKRGGTTSLQQYLTAHPDVLDAQVIGVPDLKYGEELCAWVRLREGATMTVEQLRDFCAGKLAHYKVPRYLRVCDEFPMTVTGKVQKFKMRETSIDELGLQDAAAVVTA